MHARRPFSWKSRACKLLAVTLTKDNGQAVRFVDLSPLDGKTLVERKVRLLSAMAGAYTEALKARRFLEFNVVRDITSAQAVFHQWPTPIVASGWEIGNAIQHPAQSMQDDYGYVANRPLREAYDYYRGLENDQPTWDLTSVLCAVRPDRGYFDLSPPGGRSQFPAQVLATITPGDAREPPATCPKRVVKKVATAAGPALPPKH